MMILKKQEEKYKNAKSAIQNLCEHTELRDTIMGKECTVCGKCIASSKDSIQYIKKEYIEKDYYDKVMNVCLEFARRANLKEQEQKKIYNILYNMKFKNKDKNNDI